MAFSSPCRWGTSASVTAIRASCAIRRTVAASTDINIGLKRGIRIRRIAEAAFAPQPREQAEPAQGRRIPAFWRSKVDSDPTHKILSAKRPFPTQNNPDETILPPYVVVLKQS